MSEILGALTDVASANPEQTKEFVAKIKERWETLTPEQKEEALQKLGELKAQGQGALQAYVRNTRLKLLAFRHDTSASLLAEAYGKAAEQNVLAAVNPSWLRPARPSWPSGTPCPSSTCSTPW